MKKRILALSLASIMVVSLMTGCSKSGGGEIKIGAIQPISGEVSAYGIQSRDAINMAIEEINNKGGALGGKKLKSVVIDDENNPEKSKNALTKLATQDKVAGVIGALTSNCSLAIAPEAQQRKVVMITPSSTNANVTLTGDYIFRACFIDPFQGDVNAKFAIETLKAKKAAVLYDKGNDYSNGLQQNFINTFKKLGGEVVTIESYAKGDKDFNAQLTKIKGTNPDVLFIPDYYSTVSLIAKQVKTLGIKTTMLGGDGWDEIANNAGDEVIGSYFSNHYTTDANDTEVKAFAKAYEEKYKVAPNALAALAYDATYLLANAIDKAGSTDSAAIRDALAKTDKKYVTGQIKFDQATRNPIKSAFMIKVDKVDGKLKQVFNSIVKP